MIPYQQSLLNDSFHFVNLHQFFTLQEQFLKIINFNTGDSLSNSNSIQQHIKTERSIKIQDSQSSSPTQIYQTKKKCHNRNIIQSKVQKEQSCQNNNCQNKTKNLNETQLKEKTFLLCKKCFNNFNSNNYCEYCIQIYDPTSEHEIDDKQWIMCEQCKRWNHVECVQSYGKKSLNKITQQTKYHCSSCDKKIKLKVKQSIKKGTSQYQELIHSRIKQPITILKLSNREISEDISHLRTLMFDEKQKKVKIEQNQ